MANRAGFANIANHGRQMEYLRHGIVMLPKEDPKRKARRRRAKGHRRS
ncbi:MAG: hypothetical protein J6Y02_17265 [Pseudobutyrivibrio sp.]|nr:hypothetical protein [Pseudobutyrivibrio sp.]